MNNNQLPAIKRTLLWKGCRALFCLISVTLSSFLKAEVSFFEKQAEGWHWYEDRCNICGEEQEAFFPKKRQQTSQREGA